MVGYIFKDEKSIADNASRTLRALRLFRCFMSDPNKGKYMRHRGTDLLYGTNEYEKIEEKIKVNGVYYFSIRINGKYNIIKENYEFLSKTWFDCISSFAYNFSKYTIRVHLNKKCNYIDYNGNLIYKRPHKNWFAESFYTFHCGLCVVERNNKYNYIDLNGKFLFKKWLNNCYPFSYRFGIIKLKNKWTVIKKDGTYLWDNLWFDFISPCQTKSKKICFNVWINKEKKYIDQYGNYISLNKEDLL